MLRSTLPQFKGIVSMFIPKICLNMIVKNEARIIGDCLAALAPHVDCYVICDTGSTDDTKAIVGRVMAGHGVPGEMHDCGFIDFAQARNEALDRARASGLAFDYILFCDADMTLEILDEDWKSGLVEGCYMVEQYGENLSYFNVRLVARHAGGRYRGVTHEYFDCPGSIGTTRGIRYHDRACGANRAGKDERDLRLLRRAIEAEADEGLVQRYVFYLGQTYYDMGRYGDAIAFYRERAGMGGWDEEVFYALYRLGLSHMHLEPAPEDAEGAMLDAFLRAHDTRPGRIEPLYELARFHRERGRHASGYLFAKAACARPRPEDDILFLNDAIYAYRRFDELAVCAYWCGAYQESLDLCEALLRNPAVPKDDRRRIAENRRCALDTLAPA